jgi:4-amino-4-deoxy-L-arabinose transferase-like glycosyltransferase
MVVAIFLRSWDLGWNGFNGDESIYSGQAASLLGERDFLKDFAVFRAHPLFLQSLVSAFFALFGIHDTVARLVPVIFGSLTVFITYLLAKELFNRNVALISSLVLALLPFHIVFSRQVLLDVPLSFFVIVFLYFMYKYRITQENIYSYLTGVACGFCFISKEVGLITLPIFITYSVLTRTLKLSKLGVFLSGVISGAIPFFLLLLTRHDFVNSLYLYGEFQASREATIFSTRYSSILLNEALGYVLFILIVISVILLFRDLKINKSRKFRDQTILLVLSLGVIFIFYQLLPSKGDRFMITLVPI